MRSLTVLTITCAALVAVPAFAAEFQAGFAKVDITPRDPMPMWGYGARHDALSEGIRDPLYAKATVIDTGDDKLAIVGLDLGRSPMYDMMKDIREAVKESVGVNYILMSGSHTHHGPVLELADEEGKGKGAFDDGVDYVESLGPKLIGVIERAARDVQPAQIGWGAKQVDMNRNRHTDIKPKVTDSELNVIRFDDAGGDLLALIVNYNAHPTMHPVDDLRFSAEWPGEMMKAVEDTLDTDCVFMQGAAGDMSVKTTEDTNTIETYGKALAQHVVETAEAIDTETPEEPAIQGKDQFFEFDQRVNLMNPTIKALFRQAFFPELANRALDEYRDGKIRPHLTTILLNNELALVGGSGEFFCEHALRLKERTRIKTIFFGYCNGHNMYFPTIEAAAEGGYGADPTVSWVPLGAGEEMMNQALTNIYSMQDAFSFQISP